MRGSTIFGLMSFVLGLRSVTSMRFLVRFRTRFVMAHFVHRVLLVRHRVVFGMAIMRHMLLVCVRGYDVMAVKFSGARGGSDGRTSMILGSEEGPIAAGSVLVFPLHAGGLEVMFVIPSLLFVSGTSADSAMAAVKANASNRDVVDHGAVVEVTIADVNVVDGTVVVEVMTSPVATGIAGAHVTESVIHAAVETDVRSPVTGMPEVGAFMPSPIAGRPEQADGRGRRPCSRHPVVALRAVGPVAGGPNITVPGARGLLVNGQRGWGDRDRERNSRE